MERIRIAAILAMAVLISGCGSATADLAEDACTDLAGDDFLDANSGLVDYIDELRELEPEASIPEGEEAVQEPEALRESEFWNELSESCPDLSSTLEAGPSRSELEAIAEGITDAEEAIEDFQFQVEGGLTYGGLLDSWPATSALAARGLDDFNDSADSLPAGLPSDDLTDLLAYSLAVASWHDEWAAVHDAVRQYIREDGAESAISDAYSAALDVQQRVETARDDALTPGS